MKKLFCIFCMLAMLLTLSACNDHGSTPTTDTSANTLPPADTSAITPSSDSFTLVDPFENREITFTLTKPSTKGIPNRDLVSTTSISKDHVAEFMELLGEEAELGGLLSGYVLDEAHCYNVTPYWFAKATDMKIFKFSDSCASFLLLDGEIYQLCEFFGGYGFVDATLWDFDCDGTLDLLVSSSWGSGMHRSIVSVFNPVTKKTTIIFDSSTTDTPNVDVHAVPSVPASSMHDPVWRCDITVRTIELTVNDPENFGLANLSWTASEDIGYIYLDNGTPTFVPWE